MISFNLQGQPVQLEGLGTYTPTIDLDGTVGVGHRADMEIKKHLNIPGEFKGEIENRENAFFASLKRMARPATIWSPGGTRNIRTIRSRSRPDRRAVQFSTRDRMNRQDLQDEQDKSEWKILEILLILSKKKRDCVPSLVDGGLGRGHAPVSL